MILRNLKSETMILSYSIISSVVLTCGYIAYRLLLAGENQHSFNRKILLAILAASLISPLLVLTVIMHSPADYPAVGNVELGEITGGVVGADIGRRLLLTPVALKTLLSDIYIVGSLATLLYFVAGIAALWRVIDRGEKTEFGTFDLILTGNTSKTAPFSWGRSVVMSRCDYEEFGDMILLHEHAHLRHQHWLDLVIAYAVICLQWYNPAAWAIRKQLKAVHEYQADETVMADGVDMKEYQMLLLRKAAGYGYQSLANSLNHSKLKKRVTMMYKKKTSLKRRLFALALVPAIGAGIAVTTIPSVAGVLESLAEVPEAAPVSASTGKAKERDVYTAVETMAEFPGGMEELLQYLKTTITYPESAIKEHVQGRVIVKFVIEEDGAVTDAEIIKGVSPGLDAEALRVVNNMPRWIPAKVKGKAVASNFTLPVNFSLEVEKQEQKNAE